MCCVVADVVLPFLIPTSVFLYLYLWNSYYVALKRIVRARNRSRKRRKAVLVDYSRVIICNRSPIIMCVIKWVLDCNLQLKHNFVLDLKENMANGRQ